MHRTALLVTGSVLVVGGAVTAAAGGTVLAATGTDSSLSSGSLSLVTSSTAVATEPDDLDARGTDALGRVRLAVSARSATPVFVGVGPVADVDRYLAGASTEVVEDLEVRPFRLDTAHRDGTARPAPPGSRSFWVARAEGTTATASWTVRDSSQRVVVMNADGSPGLRVQLSADVRVAHLAQVATGLLGGGLTALLAGAALVVVGGRQPRERPAPGPGGTGHPQGPPPGDRQPTTLSR
jgi:hypothetical protein